MRYGVYHRGIGYTGGMSAAMIFAMRVLETIFFVGIAGSAVVVILATWEDMHELLGGEEEHAGGANPGS
jgi:hypothetical protein